MKSNWPKNSEGQYAKARKDVAAALIEMAKGETLEIQELCRRLEITRSQFRSVSWIARKDVAKLPGGGVYSIPRDANTIYRLTDNEASENGRTDNNKGRRHFMRSRDRLKTVNTSSLDDGQTQKHRLYEAQVTSTLSALSPQKRTAAQHKMQNGKINAGDLAALFGLD